MTHQVLSRKYRPQSFEQLVGQTHVAQILRNALTSDRVGHAYLFVGPRGVGKTTTARIFAKALNCSGRDEAASADPCGACVSCVDITAGSDLDVVEMDAASNNAVDDVRRLREQVGYATVRSKYRIWIVDEVHMLSLPAFNAFLKTLEEPPDRVIFLFCTTEEHKLPETFRSRCQRIEFRPIGVEGIVGRLRLLAKREGVETEEGLLTEIATAAHGGLRDAESLLEQLIAACPATSTTGAIRREDLDLLAGRASRGLLDGLCEAVASGDAAAALDALDAALAGGCKPGVLVEQWLERLRQDLVDAARSVEGSVARSARALDVLLAKRAHLRAGADGVLVCQVAAVELARLPDARDLDALIDSLRTAQFNVARTAPQAPMTTPGRTAPAPSAPASQAPAIPPRRTAPEASLPVLDAAAVRAAWPQVLARAGEVDGRLAQALADGRPGALVDGYLEVHVGSGHGLAHSALGRREAVLAFRRVTQDVLGTPLAPRPVATESADAPQTPAPRPDEHPEVRRVTEATGGRLLDVERRAGGSEADAS